MAEIDVDAALVRALLVEQFPDLAALELILVANGWDNAVFRLGDDLAVRLPRRAASAALVDHEQRWLPRLAPALPLPVPTPERSGVPGAGYPWAWTVCRWFPGRVALDASPTDPTAAASVLGRFVGALHVPAPPEAPHNPYRGIPLAERTPRLHDGLARLDGTVDEAAIVSAWDVLVAIPPWPGPSLWLHGDLHPANVVVDRGRVSAVIDFGDITAGDPATDLAVAWMLFDDDPPRRVFRDAVGDVDDDTWRRAQGWALALGVALLSGSADNPAFAALGRRTLANVLVSRENAR